MHPSTSTAGSSATTKLLSSFDPRRARDVCTELLAGAGITVDGSSPWDVTVHDERLWTRILRDGTLGAGEAYVDGWWDSPALDQTIHRLQQIQGVDGLRDNWKIVPQLLLARMRNFQTIRRSFGSGQHHYDIGRDLYEAMLDPRMLYTCALWSTGARTLDEAQDAKLALVCTKLGLRPGMDVLDLGCGWAGFAAYAAEHHGVRVRGLTVSNDQVAYARQRYAHLPITIELDDYRNATGRYDAVVSIGLMEHVGPKNYRGYMEVVDRCLAPGGVAFIHTIGGNRARPRIDPWFDKYVFPNAVLPSLAQLITAMEGLFVPEDVHNIGEDYDPTLMAWFARFDAAWPELRARYDERFYRMWKFYLLASAGSFRARAQQLFQIVMTRRGTRAPAGRRG
jgi:cyclopropane-fatty-acyl-phospholipid synthase